MLGGFLQIFVFGFAVGLPWVFVCGFAAGFCCGFRFLSWVLIGYGGGADWVWWWCSLGLGLFGGCADWV